MLPHISKGDFVWLDSSLAHKGAGAQQQFTPPPDFPAIAARVLAIWTDQQGGEHILLLDDQGNKLELGSIELQRWAIRPMHPTSIQGVPDLVQMAEVHEASLLRNLQIRYKQRIFHTFIGPRILLSLWPQHENCMNTSENQQLMQQYRNRPLREHSPHIYSIGAGILNSLKNSAGENGNGNGQNFCVVFTGETGSGKSESVKHVLKFLTAENSAQNMMTAKIEAAMLLLEEFANAKTPKNFNASRHGKHLEIKFAGNSEGEVFISAAQFSLFLLEKHRVVEAAIKASSESNFHIFYTLMNGVNAQQKLDLDLTNDRISNYRLLASFRQNSRDFIEDEPFGKRRELSEISAAMRTLLLREAEIEAVWKLLAAILHLGNLRYNVRIVNGQERLELNDVLNMKRISRLLKIDENLLQQNLTTKITKINSDQVCQEFSIGEAIDARDKLMVEIYAHVVEFIVGKINEALAGPKFSAARKEEKIGSINIVDFQGIENNIKCGNSFEQLCVNYAAECIQQFFIRRTYKLEQAEYGAQGLPDWEPDFLPFVDNQQVLEILAVQPLSVMSVIDDVSASPKASDDELLSKLHFSQCQNERFYQRPKSELVKQFAIRHYMDIVQYKTSSMLDKNRDEFPSQLHSLIQASESKFLRRLFDGTTGIGSIENGSSQSRRIKQQTKCTQIRREMNALMVRLERCEEVYFVRCIKANEAQKIMQFDSELVLRQIRQFDLLSVVEMCKAGFPIHMDYAQFIHKYRALLPGIPPSQICHCSQAAQFICKTIFGEQCCAESIQFGKSKIFIKADQHQTLEIMRERRLHNCAKLVQKCLNGWAKRQQFERLRWAAVVFQKNWRAMEERKKYLKFLRGITRLQAMIRAHQLVYRYQWLRNSIVHFQANCRAALLRHQLRCLPTRAGRHQAMMARLEWQMASEGPAPALAQHANEFDTVQENAFGAIHLVRNNGKCHPSGQITRSLLCAKDGNLGKYKWEKFALAHFQQTQCTPKHTRLRIRRSLLAHQNPVDELVAISIWHRLLQVMGDMKVDSSNNECNEDVKTKMPPIHAQLKTIYGKEYGPLELQYLHAELMNHNICLENNLKLRKSLRMARNFFRGEPNCTALEKIQYILCAGIQRPELRDEIFSQLCKQINGNPSSVSKSRGWTILTLCASTFLPYEKLLPYLLNFIHKNAPTEEEAMKMEAILCRTRKNGTRRQPIIKAELAAACLSTNSQLVVNVNLADGQIVPVPLDSQTTAGELCVSLAAQICLEDAFGFGFFISIGTKSVRALGAGNEKIMDALSLAEQQAECNWNIYFRKEIFRPFHSTKSDPIAVDLAYKQIVRGVHLGEYQCENEEHLALLSAQQYFIATTGKHREIDVSELEELLPEFMPTGIFNFAEENSEIRQKWIQLVLHAYRKKIIKTDEMPLPNVDTIKCQVLEFASHQWPLLFSRFFEVYKFSGPPLPINQLTLAVNSAGVTILDSRDEQQQKVLLDVEYIQLGSVGFGRSKQPGAEAVSLQLLNGDRYTFQSAQARELSQLLSYMLNGLRQNSHFAITTKDLGQGKNLLEMAKGDLLILDAPFGQKYQALKNCDENPENQLISGVENTRTGLRANVPMKAMQILACTEKPTQDKLMLLQKPESNDANSSSDANIYGGSSNGGIYEYPTFYQAGPFGIPIPIISHFPQPHSLERFATDNFRQPQNMSNSMAHFGVESDLWRHSREPLKAPLLKRIVESGKEEAIEECLISYTFILKYMGDQPSHPMQYFVEHTDLIFAAPLKFEILRDETYCQLMKQLTDNPNPMSEERGWELLWLCLGLFPPSKGLRRELTQFVRTRLLPMAADCAIRLQKALSQCTDPSLTRRFPPHQVELEAIQHRQTQIYHKFYLPDGTQDTVEVESWTRAKDFAQKIAIRIGLNSTVQGFGLFVKLGEKVVCIPEHAFFFDFIHQLQDWARKSGRRRNGGLGMTNANFNYQVHFMRKLWLDVVPGEDPRQDLIFHYHQELPKYLRGYHRIDKKEAVRYGALILRAQTKDDKQPPVQHVQHILHDLVPKDLLKSYSGSEWKKLISTELEIPGMPKTSADAKLAFLQEIAKETTFGSAFFEVKQSADPTLCQKLLVAINKDGMSLYELESKRHICTYGFQQIAQWQPANTYFHVTLDKGNRLLFETTLGHKMDDLLTSYIQALIARQEKQKAKLQKALPPQIELNSAKYQNLAVPNGRREFA